MTANQLLITVGTSLLANLRRHESLKTALAEKQLLPILKYLQAQPSPLDRQCGAELNSTFQLLEQGKVHADSLLHFCVSDTADGQWVGQILAAYTADQKLRAKVHTIEGLQDQDPQRFSREGLRNLVRLCGKIIHEAGGSQWVALNATGGYKAQIAIAALIGSALRIPVYYKHENFDSVVGFPPMPVAFDDSLIQTHMGYLLQLEDPQTTLPYPPDTQDEALIALLDIEQVDGTTIYALSPLGQICLTSYLQRYPLKTTLPPTADPEKRKPPSLRQDHYPIGFEEYVKKVWQETPYIIQCVSTSYNGQHSIRDRHFYSRFSVHTQEDQVIGEYVDRNKFGARFILMNTATSPRERAAIVRDLNERYGV